MAENWKKPFLTFLIYGGSKQIWLEMEKMKMFQVTPNGKKFEISQEDKLIGIGHHRKMTLKDDNLTSRQDEGFTERRHHRN